MSAAVKQDDTGPLSGSAVIPLSKEITINGTKTKTLTMREPTVGDQLVADEMQGSDLQKEIAMMSNLCQIAPEDLKALGLRDYKRIQATYGRFII